MDGLTYIASTGASTGTVLDLFHIPQKELLLHYRLLRRNRRRKIHEADPYGTNVTIHNVVLTPTGRQKYPWMAEVRGTIQYGGEAINAYAMLSIRPATARARRNPRAQPYRIVTTQEIHPNESHGEIYKVWVKKTRAAVRKQMRVRGLIEREEGVDGSA